MLRLRTKPLVLHVERMAQVSGQEASHLSPWQGILGMSNQKRTMGQAQNMQEGLCIPFGLGMPSDPPGRAGGHD